MRKLFLTFISLCLLVCLTGCGLKNKHTFRDFMCNMDEGHIEVTENGGKRYIAESYDNETLMLCDFYNNDGFYDIYWKYPETTASFDLGFMEVPESAIIHNDKKTIYDMTYTEVNAFGTLTSVYCYYYHKETIYDAIEALNKILDGDDYQSEIAKYYDYCEKHKIYYEKGTICGWCKDE